MTTTDIGTQVPAYIPGTWIIDPVHSEVSFSVRHLMLSKVRGRFTSFGGQLVTGGDPLESRVEATVDLSSIDTNNADRDTHLRSADFFDVEQHPSMTYRSTGVRATDDGYIVDGELSLHGITRPVPLALEVEGFLPTSPFGDSRVGFTASADINRSDFGIKFNMVLDNGGVGLGEKVHVTLDIEAVLQTNT